jgi:hypothetical protein
MEENPAAHFAQDDGSFIFCYCLRFAAAMRALKSRQGANGTNTTSKAKAAHREASAY